MEPTSPKSCCETSVAWLGALSEAPADSKSDGDDKPQTKTKTKTKKKFASFAKHCKELKCKCDSIVYNVPKVRLQSEDAVDGTAAFYGDVKWVIRGNTPEYILKRALDARSFRYAFEAGTVAPVGDNGAIGEMIAFNGTAYVRSTRSGTEEYYKTVSNSHVRSPAALVISPADAVPDVMASTKYGGMTWTSAMNDVYATMNEANDVCAVAFGGVVTFDKFVGVAVARSTIHDEDLFLNKRKYYPFPPTVSYSMRCVVFGVVGDVEAAEARGVEKLDTVLYKGASGAAGSGGVTNLALHTHVVTLKPHCFAQTPQQVHPEDVADCFHLDSSSVVGSFDLELWAIKETLVQHPTVEEMSQDIPAQVPPARCSCAEWICNALVDAGVTHIFGGHGGALVPLVNAVVRNPNLQWIVTRNEANASLMAAAYAKLTGNLGACIATSGPGATNLTTGLYDAHLDQCSMIAITGLKPRGGIGYSEFQDFQQSRMFAAGGLPFSYDVASADAVVPLLRDAVSKALTMRTCVHLGIPVDVQATECPVETKRFCAADARSRTTFPSAQMHVLDKVAMEIKLASQRGGSRIVITIGHRCTHAGPKILKLAEKIRAPVLTRLDAKGSVDESHPLAFGCIGVHGKPGLEQAANLIGSAQLVLSFGNHDDTLILCNRAGLQVRPMIQFEPDAASVLASARYRALHEVVGEIEYAITNLLEKLEHLEMLEKQETGKSADAAEQDAAEGLVDAWENELEESGMDMTSAMQSAGPRPPRTTAQTQNTHDELWRQINNYDPTFVAAPAAPRRDRNPRKRYTLVHQDDHRYCHPEKVFQAMGNMMGPEDVMCVDTGDVTLWASLCAQLTKGSRTLSSERMGTMGYSICAGIAACLVREDRGRAVVVVGDGGAQMTINELGTVKQIFANPNTAYKMLLVIFDNQVLGRVAFGFDGSLGCDLGPSPDFVELSRAYGGDGAKLTRDDEVPGALYSAFASTGLYVLHVMVDPNVKADMAIFQDNSSKMMNSG